MATAQYHGAKLRKDNLSGFIIVACGTAAFHVSIKDPALAGCYVPTDIDVTFGISNHEQFGEDNKELTKGAIQRRLSSYIIMRMVPHVKVQRPFILQLTQHEEQREYDVGGGECWTGHHIASEGEVLRTEGFECGVRVRGLRLEAFHDILL